MNTGATGIAFGGLIGESFILLLSERPVFPTESYNKGGACYITTVVAGLVIGVDRFWNQRSVRVGRFNFIRDMCALLVAVAAAIWIVADGKIYAWEIIIILSFYLLYPTNVFVICF